MTDLFFELETVALVLILKLVVLYFIRFGGPLCSFGRHPGGFEFAETLPRRPASLPLHKIKTASRTSEVSSAVAESRIRVLRDIRPVVQGRTQRWERE